MVGSRARRKLASYFREAHARPVSRACALASISRATWYYRTRLPERDGELIAALRALAHEHPARGFDNYYARLRAAGHVWGRKRCLRVYRRLGLRRRTRRKRHVTPTEDRRPMAALSRRDEVWACDFPCDGLTDGRPARVIAVVDEYSRECLASEAAISYPAQRVCRVLDRVAGQRGGYPEVLRTDNGPEFVSTASAAWCEHHGVHHHRITPGRPMDDGRVERLDRAIREDVLDFWMFTSFSELNAELANWRGRYNATHPHTALGGQSPGAFDRGDAVLADSAYGLPRQHCVQESLPLHSNPGLS